MAAEDHIHIYQGAVTAGGTNGTQVSEGTNLAPVSVGPLNATDNEVSDPVKLAVRCDEGFITSGNTIISLTGETADKWALAPDNAGQAGTFGAYGAALTITAPVGDTNTIFWAKARATEDEPDPTNDRKVKFNTAALIAEAE